MNIYLVRHGDAVYQDSDDLSPLSAKGEHDIDTLAKFLLPLQLRARVFHSEKLRAKQTAERLAVSMIVNDTVTFREGLSPCDSVLSIANELNEADTDTMLVGHMPFMGKLASQLLYQNENRDVVNFHKGTIVCLQLIGYGQWVIDWVIHPGII